MAKDTDLTRRATLVAGIAGTAGLGVLANSSTDKKAPMSRMPLAFVPHGGGPWPFVDIGMNRSEFDSLASYLRSVQALPKTPPKALLVISAHWEEAVLTVQTSAKPPILYDYYGFPPESYTIPWPAAGHPELATRVRALLSSAGFETAADAERGFDHGTFIPLKLAYPNAEIPTIQLSLKAGLDPAEHIKIGQALASLRDEGVFIVGSGMSYHNMRGFRDPRGPGHSEQFDAWLSETATLAPSERNTRLAKWAEAPAARLAHPREEHLLPLMVIAGAAGEDQGTIGFAGRVFGTRVSAYHFG